MYGFFSRDLALHERFLSTSPFSPPPPHNFANGPSVNKKHFTRVSVAYRFSSGWYIRIRKPFHSDLCHLQIERINDNEEGTVDMDMLEEKLQVNSDQTSM